MLVLETSLGTERTTGLIHPRVLEEDDRAGLIGFHRTAVLLQPLTADREELAAALQRSGARAGIIVGGRGSEALNLNPAVDLVAALKKACGEFGRLESNERKRAVVVFVAGEDPNLSMNLASLGTAAWPMPACMASLCSGSMHPGLRGSLVPGPRSYLLPPR
jgi:hypothetical protein